MHHTDLANLRLAQQVEAARIKACEDIVGYTFQNKEKLAEALESTGTRAHGQADEGNKRIALVGDRVLSLILAEEWHASGELRVWRSTGSCEFSVVKTSAAVYSRNASESVCTNAHLARLCLHHGLEDIVTGHSGNLSKWRLATIIEAILGAAYCDGGLPAARAVMTTLGLFSKNTDIMTTSNLRGAPQDLMILSTAGKLAIWTPCRASE